MTRTLERVSELQSALNHHHGYEFMCSGIYGPKTHAAVLKLVGDPPVQGIPGLEFPWVKHFASFVGESEIKGPKHNPAIIERFKAAFLPFRDDETPYCASFLCGILEEVGIRSPRSGMARSFHWKKWGQVLDGPAVGAVVSMWRGRKAGTSGHCGLVVGRDASDNLMVLGANQKDSINIMPFDTKRVLSYHWPEGFPLPLEIGFEHLPIIKSDGVVSTNEA